MNKKEVQWNDPRVIKRARELCILDNGSPCDGPGNDCDEWTCSAVAQAVYEIRGGDISIKDFLQKT